MARKSSITTESYTWKTSAFYRRLESLSRKSAPDRELLTKVEFVAGKASEISRYVVAFLPQYTDHGERHLTNVLQFMEELAGPKSIQLLSAVECALAIMAAMTHDLGMVLDEEEQKEVTESEDEPTTPAGRAWQSFRDGHGLWHRYQRLDAQEKGSERARKMLGQLKADYIRHTHAKETGHTGYNRILRWLDHLATGKGTDFYRHKGFSFREGLAYLAMSHGQDIGWLPDRLAAPDSPYAQVKADRAKVFACGPDKVNWPWLSWLLRLGDVMDCDASRTPAVLFETIGITDPTSQTEWKKHLSIPQRPEFKQGDDGQTLLYQCPTCPDPFIEKAIRDILGWINDEVEKVRLQQDSNSRLFDENKGLSLALPSKADVEVAQRVGNYEYLDLHFRLDRGAVMELLMGEALYGEPDLALRELVQNSLDAVHLRDLRVQLQRALARADQSGELPVPVVAPDLAVEPLEVQVRWDTPQTDRPWIEIIDNGVGMTKGVIERFLTQIGKSYYKSPNFLRERELMKRHGLLCTTISQFGIGFLSAFMLAEDVEIETRAAAKGGGLETGWHVKIHEAHGLIALYPLKPNGIKTTGTRVRLTLKKGLQLEPFEPNRLVARLRFDFYWLSPLGGEKLGRPTENFVEPAWSVGRCIVWPLWPVKLLPPNADPISLDQGFHERELLPLDRTTLQAKADERSYPTGSLGAPRWAHLDWVDDRVWTDGSTRTGSRIRVSVPWHTADDTVTMQSDNEVPGLMRRSDLLSLTEAQLPKQGRTLVLVNGVRVPEWKNPLARWLRQAGGVGTLLWLDLRGPATPRLKADRRGPTQRQEVQDVVRQLQEVFHERCGQRSVGADAWFRLAIVGLSCLSKANEKASLKAWAIANRLPQLSDGSGCWGAASALLLEEMANSDARQRDLDTDLDTDPNLDRDRALYPVGTLASQLVSPHARDFFRLLDRVRSLARSLVHCRNHSHFFVHRLAQDLDLDRVRDLNSDSTRVRTLNLDVNTGGIFEGWGHWLDSQFIPEGLQPSLNQAYPPWCLPGATGAIGQLVLGGPMVLRSTGERIPTWAEDLDLLVPLTGNPLGPLARKCPRWTTERALRPMFTLPFMLGCVPIRWQEKAGEIAAFLGVDDVLAYVPDPAHWAGAFTEIPRSDFGDGPVPEFVPESVWQDSGVTALWDIQGNRVLWAEKFRSREEMRRVGKSLEDWAKP